MSFPERDAVYRAERQGWSRRPPCLIQSVYLELSKTTPITPRNDAGFLT